jgi:hypothetical protein
MKEWIHPTREWIDPRKEWIHPTEDSPGEVTWRRDEFSCWPRSTDWVKRYTDESENTYWCTERKQSSDCNHLVDGGTARWLRNIIVIILVAKNLTVRIQAYRISIRQNFTALDDTSSWGGAQHLDDDKPVWPTWAIDDDEIKACTITINMLNMPVNRIVLHI